jgi:lysozyme
VSIFGLTPEYIAWLKHEEGFRRRPYRDQAGLPTIGYGHRIPSMDHPPLKDEAAGHDLLMQDLEVYNHAALMLSPGLRQDTPRRISAITDFCFNAGIGAYKGSTLRKRVNVQDWPAAQHEMKRWVYITTPDGRKVVDPVLAHRRAMTAEWLNG